MAIFTYVFGGVLVVLLIIAFIYYFSPKRKDTVEQPKYDIIKDEEKN
ncbi:MAG: CcoQ/FixQ family Cbb3-type cytochrome c oxidase assembly chaperone [Deferribacteraceae bacterium]|jgi:cbb3-type cytochrome oxidase subunit 3|nr:CcoQ/FixQ family Cbb3-type cytochrome c oxidase assembly chaperone [Deferribacteraceae bacterium]